MMKMMLTLIGEHYFGGGINSFNINMNFNKLINNLLNEEDEMPSREDRISAMDNLGTRVFDSLQIARDLVDQQEAERIEAEEGGWELDFDEIQMLPMVLRELQKKENYTDEQIEEIEKEYEKIYNRIADYD